MDYSRILFCALVLSAVTGRADVVINEIHYNPSVKTDLVEFIELFNAGATAVNLEGWQIRGDVQYAFPAGSTVAPGGYAVVAQSPASLEARFGVMAFGPWSGFLSNKGETVELRDAGGALVDEVDYSEGFPWPAVGEAPGYSIELVNPMFDNSLGGNWRRSLRGAATEESRVLIAQRSDWKYRKGTSEASNPIDAWRQADFDDTGWSLGPAPIGYDPEVVVGTALSDMRNRYTSVYFRKKFEVDDPAQVSSLSLEALYDDGIQVFINGVKVASSNMPNRNVAYDELSTGGTREANTYDSFAISSPRTLLLAGENVIAVQLQNVSLNGSSDAFLDVKLTAHFGSLNAGPTPGAQNVVYDTNSPPVIRQVDHSPEQPSSGELVTITAKVTDLDGVASVQLLYQIVDPGQYIELNDAEYENNWVSLEMRDDGLAGDAHRGDSIYTVVLPASLQVHRRLMRFRITATDAGNRAVRVPYEDDPEPNFAYFVYDGVPEWEGAIQPGSADATRNQRQTFSAKEMGRLPVYHLISKRKSVEDATWNSRYAGSDYPWWGTLVYDGKVYDHIRYRARGGVWRYAMGKNMWKFDLNRGHEFQARDNYGRKYRTTWKKINLGANIQQGNFLHRGEQGMFESLGFKLFNLVGVEAPGTQWVTYRVIDKADEETAGNQYGGDFWGLYLAIEQEDGRFLDEHELPDGNLYKMEGGTGTLNNQGLTAATDTSDLDAFLNTYRSGTESVEWWKQRFDLNRYYSYQTVVQGVHHYDICDGKNYFYFLNPETERWSIHPWDMDLTWADNMYRDCDGADPFHSLVVDNGMFHLEFNNRAREIRDLLFNRDQAFKLIDEYAEIVTGTNSGPNVLAADRAMWDFNPVMTNASIVNLSKAGRGMFYQFPFESGQNPARRGNFGAAIDIMKDYVVERSAFLDERISDDRIPKQPNVTFVGPPGFAVNRIELQSSSFSGPAAFTAMKWRLAEVRDAAPGVSGIYEIQPVWETPEISPFNSKISVPAEQMKVGHRYRARVRLKDATGRWSHWSAAVEFLTGEPDSSAALQEYVRPTEIMYNPASGPECEFVELQNVSSNVTVELVGATFTDGIDFTFPSNARLAPREFALVVQADSTNDFAAFRQFYGLEKNAKIYGPYSGSLDNSGERLTFKAASGGAVVFSLVYDDGGDWPGAADGNGYSLVLREGITSNAALDDPASWRASSALNGSPGRADAAPLEIGIARGSSGISLQFAATAERNYRIESRETLSAGSWKTVQEYSNATGVISLHQPIASEGRRYYRVVVTPR